MTEEHIELVAIGGLDNTLAQIRDIRKRQLELHRSVLDLVYLVNHSFQTGPLFWFRIVAPSVKFGIKSLLRGRNPFHQLEFPVLGIPKETFKMDFDGIRVKREGYVLSFEEFTEIDLGNYTPELIERSFIDWAEKKFQMNYHGLIGSKN